MVSGFPNMFVVTGPGSPGVKTQMIASIEQHVDWIADCLAHMHERGLGRIEATPQAYRVKGAFSIPEVNHPSWSHPVVLGGKLYLREQDNLYVYDVKRG